MISFDEALSAVLANANPRPTTRVALEKALGYVLAQSVQTSSDLPLFDNSAVDGFGVRVADVDRATADSPVRLTVDRTIRAGNDLGKYVLPQRQAVKILTGAPVPGGVETVIMREYCREEDAVVYLEKAAKVGENIRRQGEEYHKGERVLCPGMRITPPVVGMLATVGLTEVEVYRKPQVAVIVTGDELIKPGSPLQPGQIYESNSFALAAILRDMGIDEVQSIHLGDDKDAITEGIREALANCEIVITVGGVSVGDYDFVKTALADLGVEQIYWKIKMKPGKPNYLGVHGRDDASKTMVFGLPGNPVSAQISFHQLVRPALLKMMGLSKFERQRLLATLATDLQTAPGRQEFVRGIATTEEGRLVVRPVAGQGSHMQGGLVEANCIIDVPPEGAELKEGDQVFVELLTWR